TKPKILIVDDDPDLRRGLNLRLRANHYDTSYATDGFSAIAMAQKERPDLIILDIGLPAGDGFVVLDRLQQSAALSAIPVIVLTARDPQFNRERTLKAGATAFLQKPADNSELLNVIRAIPPGRARWALRKTSVFVQINSSFGHGVDLLLYILASVAQQSRELEPAHPPLADGVLSEGPPCSCR